jgi:hypothetical protein
MRINVYDEEMTDRIEVIERKVNGNTFTGLRFYLELPVTTMPSGEQVRGPFLHGPSDDESSAVTFWSKDDMRGLLEMALTKLDEHYGDAKQQGRG